MANTAPLKIIEVVAAIIERNGHILLAQRDNSRDQAGLWEFPGGKIEQGETQPQALQRELSEELGIEARIDGWVTSHDWQQTTRVIRLHAWRVGDFSGSLTLSCHTECRWVKAQDAHHYPLAPADIPLLEAYITQKNTV